jgi:hypothetical protein
MKSGLFVAALVVCLSIGVSSNAQEIPFAPGAEPVAKQPIVLEYDSASDTVAVVEGAGCVGPGCSGGGCVAAAGSCSTRCRKYPVRRVVAAVASAPVRVLRAIRCR